jgi:hypothetical protein
MYQDHEKRVEDIRRRTARESRIACFVMAFLAHMIASGALLALQTSCFVPRCVDSIGFDVFRSIMHVPLFVTPWLSLPSPDLDYVRDWTLLPLLVLNATLAVTLYWGLGAAVYRGYRYWRARQWERLRAAHRGR